MTGEMRIRGTENGYGIDTDLEQVSIMDKFELLYSVALALQFDKTDLKVFFRLVDADVLSDASRVTACKNADQLERMLYPQVEPKSEQAAMFRHWQKVLDYLSMMEDQR